MKFLFVILFCSMMTSLAHASLMKCDIVAINGSVPQKPSTVTFESDKALLEFNRGDGPETLFGKDSIYVADANAIWFDRTAECQYTRKTPTPHMVSHNFQCGKEITDEASLTIDASIGGGSFKSILNVPNMPSENFSFSFLRCQNI